MKKLLGIASRPGALATTFIAVVALACHSPQPPGGPVSGATGGRSATDAIHLFFDAVHSEDLQQMSVVWGTKEGPTRDHIPHDELEKREVILQCYFAHDSYRILGRSGDIGGGQSFKVELTRGSRTRTTTVSTVEGPGSRWYVQSLDMAAVRDFCASAPDRP